MKILIAIIMFFLIAMFFIISENNLALSKPGNIDKFVGLYSSWMSQIFDNSANLAGYVVKMDWLPENNKTG